MKNFIAKLTSPIVYASALAIAGILLIFLSGTALDIAAAILGGIIAVIAIVGIITTILSADHAPILSLFGYPVILKCSVALLFAGALIAIRSTVSELSCNILGMLLTLYSFVKIARPSHRLAPRTREWYITSVLYSILAIYGVFMIFFPLWQGGIIGIALVLLGAKWIYTEIRKLKSRSNTPKKPTRVRTSPKNNTRNGGGTFYTDDFVDKT